MRPVWYQTAVVTSESGSGRLALKCPCLGSVMEFMTYEVAVVQIKCNSFSAVRINVLHVQNALTSAQMRASTLL